MERALSGDLVPRGGGCRGGHKSLWACVTGDRRRARTPERNRINLLRRNVSRFYGISCWSWWGWRVERSGDRGGVVVSPWARRLFPSRSIGFAARVFGCGKGSYGLVLVVKAREYIVERRGERRLQVVKEGHYRRVDVTGGLRREGDGRGWSGLRQR